MYLTKLEVLGYITHDNDRDKINTHFLRISNSLNELHHFVLFTSLLNLDLVYAW